MGRLAKSVRHPCECDIKDIEVGVPSASGAFEGMLKILGTALVALGIGAAGGILFFILHLPLPWTLGSITATGIVAAMGRRWLMPTAARMLARPLVGVVAGSAFTPALAASAMQWWGAILFVVLFSAGTTCLGYVYFRKLGQFDAATAFFASSPGGLGEMTLLGGTFGGDMRSIVLVHSTRIVVAVFLIPIFLQILLGHPVGRVSPFAAASVGLSLRDVVVLSLCAIAGFALARIVRYPPGTMIFALVFSATVHVLGISEASLPPWVTALMQVLIGGVAGARFAGVRWREARRVLVLALVWAFVVVLIVGIAASASSWILGRPFVAMFLSLAPGGVVEMAVITFALGIEVAFVVTCQVSRILIILVLMPLSYRFLFKSSQPGGGSGA
jgi:membrane AbrB-like protein